MEEPVIDEEPEEEELMEEVIEEAPTKVLIDPNFCIECDIHGLAFLLYLERRFRNDPLLQCLVRHLQTFTPSLNVEIEVVDEQHLDYDWVFHRMCCLLEDTCTFSDTNFKEAVELLRQEYSKQEPRRDEGEEECKEAEH